MIAESRKTGSPAHESMRRLIIGTGGLVVVGCFAIAYALSTAAL